MFRTNDVDFICHSYVQIQKYITYLLSEIEME